MNYGRDAICNMELLYSESLFNFGFLYIYRMRYHFKCFKYYWGLGHSLDWCRLNGHGI